MEKRKFQLTTPMPFFTIYPRRKARGTTTREARTKTVNRNNRSLNTRLLTEGFFIYPPT
jgi:hypothetical protein